MEQILHTFGIDVRLIVIQIFNFVLLAVALWYFLYTPILNILRDRQKKIEKGVLDAEQAKERLAEAENEKRGILSTAQKEAETVNANARAHADEQSAEIVGAAEVRAGTIVKSAEERGEEIKAQAVKESDAEIARLAILAAEKVLREKQS